MFAATSIEPESIPYLFNTDIFIHEEKNDEVIFSLNEKKISNAALLVVHHDKKNEWMISADSDVLKRIIARLQIDLNEVAVINTAFKPAVSFLEMKNDMKVSKIILFGVHPKDAGIQLESANNKVISFCGVQIAIAKRIDELGAASNAISFWNEVVVPMFNVEKFQKK